MIGTKLVRQSGSLIWILLLFEIGQLQAQSSSLFGAVDEVADEFCVQFADVSRYSGVSIRGELKASITWEDNAGENLLVLTETGIQRRPAAEEKSAELFAYHFQVSGDSVSLLRRVYDFEKDCPFDTYVGFLDSSLTITDLDGDGLTEVTFIYKLTCRSDVSPSRMKLIMLENNVKFALRGLMVNDFVKKLPADERQGYIEEFGWGQFTIDKAFERAPKTFLDFAIGRWEQFKDKDLFVQME